MLLTKIILIVSVLIVLFFPNQIIKLTGFNSKLELLQIWNIYAFIIVLVLFNISINKALKIGILLTIIYYTYLLINKDISKKFYFISIPLNIIVFLDL